MAAFQKQIDGLRLKIDEYVDIVGEREIAVFHGDMRDWKPYTVYPMTQDVETLAKAAVEKSVPSAWHVW